MDRFYVQGTHILKINSATGNDRTSGADANMDGYINTRFTISVASVSKTGRHASYSTPGAAVFLTAPGGDDGFATNFLVPKAGGGCHDIGYGKFCCCCCCFW